MSVKQWSVGDVLAAADVNAWLVPAAAVKSSSTSRTSTTTLADDPALTLPVAANAAYWVELIAIYDGATAGDINLRLTVPTSATTAAVILGITPSGTVNSDDVTVATDTVPVTTGLGALGAGTAAGALIKAIVTTSSTAGNITVQWAQLSSSGTATILHAGSALIAQRIG